MKMENTRFYVTNNCGSFIREFTERYIWYDTYKKESNIIGTIKSEIIKELNSSNSPLTENQSNEPQIVWGLGTGMS